MVDLGSYFNQNTGELGSYLSQNGVNKTGKIRKCTINGRNRILYLPKLTTNRNKTRFDFNWVTAQFNLVWSSSAKS